MPNERSSKIGCAEKASDHLKSNSLKHSIWELWGSHMPSSEEIKPCRGKSYFGVIKSYFGNQIFSQGSFGGSETPLLKSVFFRPQHCSRPSTLFSTFSPGTNLATWRTFRIYYLLFFLRVQGEGGRVLLRENAPQSEVQVTNLLPYCEKCGEVVGDKS